MIFPKQKYPIFPLDFFHFFFFVLLFFRFYFILIALFGFLSILLYSIWRKKNNLLFFFSSPSLAKEKNHFFRFYYFCRSVGVFALFPGCQNSWYRCHWYVYMKRAKSKREKYNKMTQEKRNKRIIGMRDCVGKSELINWTKVMWMYVYCICVFGKRKMRFSYNRKMLLEVSTHTDFFFFFFGDGKKYIQW